MPEAHVSARTGHKSLCRQGIRNSFRRGAGEWLGLSDGKAADRGAQAALNWSPTRSVGAVAGTGAEHLADDALQAQGQLVSLAQDDRPILAEALDLLRRQ